MGFNRTTFLAAGMITAGLGFSGPAAAEDPKAAAPAVNAVEGGKTFLRYCALCHGIDGIGLGPLAESLQKAPPEGVPHPAQRTIDGIGGPKLSAPTGEGHRAAAGARCRKSLP